MTDKDGRPLLQRRGGRRISVPSSPISPLLPKQIERTFRSADIFKNQSSPAIADAPTDQPTIDLTFPSSALEGVSFASHTAGERSRDAANMQKVAVDESEKSRIMEPQDNSRGVLSSSRGSESKQSLPSRPTYLADMNTRSSPIIGRNSEGRDRNFETPISGGRNFSTTSLLTDRSISDENVSTKANTTKKSRLNLLNPMSLLARRRSSHNTKLEDINVNLSPLQLPAIPDNFDPSIRGNFVHDFSTPRSKRSHFDNSPRREAFSSPTNFRRPSDFGTPGTQHGSSPSLGPYSPVSRERFQDDSNALQPGQNGYVHNAAGLRKHFDAPSPPTLPTFGQNFQTIPPELPKTDEPKKIPSLNIPHPTGPPPPPPERTPSPPLALSQATLFPKHMNSVSSRFSFQIADQASSAQERLLEEKHKEHFAKDPSKDKITNDVLEDDYDDYDFDADDGLEEKIPGVNIDFEDDDGFYNDYVPTKDIDVQSSQQQVDILLPSLQEFHFTPISTAFSPTSAEHSSELTPRDQNGFVIGVADSQDFPTDDKIGYLHEKIEDSHVTPLFFEGLRISTVDQNYGPLQEPTPPHDFKQDTFDDMDLYFDDGEFDMDLVEPENNFDEEILDDPTQIKDIPAENARKYEAAFERSLPGDQVKAVDPQSIGLSRDTSSSSNFVDLYRGDSSGFSPSCEHEQSLGLLNSTSVLTEGNLAAYHDALAEAANSAAANGKFNRQVSFSSNISSDMQQFPMDEDRINLPMRGSHSQNDVDSEGLNDYDSLAYDDDLDDDLMIAEANAEVLENDDDGFYGQEFGFYARAHGKDVTDLVNGGYFAARGSNGIKRSHSGKANFQEPSLTPITERSEWSTRNSVASLPIHGGFPGAAQSVPSPGISQLMDSASFEDEMTLTALMKLRRGAFGGSSTSINSMGDRSMPGSSPLAHVSSYSFPPPETNHNFKQSTTTASSILESEEEDDDLDVGQLTLTQNTPRKKISGVPTPAATPRGQMTYLSVTESPHTVRKIHHRRNSSGAESVSYIRDSDGQWVLERRRTGEDGEQEVIGREYLAGARI